MVVTFEPDSTPDENLFSEIEFAGPFMVLTHCGRTSVYKLSELRNVCFTEGAANGKPAIRMEGVLDETMFTVYVSAFSDIVEDYITALKNPPA